MTAAFSHIILVVLLGSFAEHLLTGHDDLCIAISADQVVVDTQELHIQTIELEGVLIRAIADSEDRTRCPGYIGSSTRIDGV